MTVGLPSAPGGRIDAVRALSPHALREVHAILRMWPSIKYQLAEGEGDALHGGYCSMGSGSVGRSGRPSNPTQGRAIRLASDGRLSSLRRIDNAIERALAIAATSTPPTKIGWAMRQHYLKGRDWGRIAADVRVSVATTVVWRRRFSVLVWEQLKGRKRWVSQ